MVIKRVLAAVTASIVGLAAFGGSLAVAQDNGSGSGLAVSPTRYQLTIDAGQSKTVDISVRNVTGGEINVRSVINDFESDNKSGEPRIIADASRQTPYSIKKFIPNLTDIRLNTNEEKKVSYKITVPADATPGAYFGIIRYTAVPIGRNAPGGGEVALTASIGAIILIEVPGNIKEDMLISRLGAASGSTVGTYFFGVPKKSLVEIKNVGNGFAQPFGKVTVANMKGKEVFSYELNNTDPRANVLPGSSREFSDDLKNVSGFGRYQMVASIAYGPGSQVVTGRATFWVIPIGLLVAFVAGLLLLILLPYIYYRRHYSRRRK